MKTIHINAVEAFLECRYKAYLLLNGKSGEKSEYELFLNELDEIYKDKFLASIRKRTGSIKFNLQISSETFRLNLDAIESTKPKTSEHRQYIPYFILPTENVLAGQKLMAGFVCSILNDLAYPTNMAKIIYGSRQQTTRIVFNHYANKSSRLKKNFEKFLNQNDEPSRYRIKHCQVCEFQTLCLAEFRERDDLSLLGGMREKQIGKLNNKGIFTVNQLSYTYRPRRRKKKVVKPDRLEHSLKALALREKKTFVLDTPTIRNSEWDVYLDLEGITDENFFYLIGVLCINQKSGERIEKSFWADTQEDTKAILENFSNIILGLNNFTIFHYGSYDMQALKKINKRLNGDFDEFLTKVSKNSVNILSIFTSDLYPPTYTNGLKDIAQYIGFDWSHEGASGLQSFIWRKQWELTNDEGLKDKLIEYNRDDCEALHSIKKWIVQIGKRGITPEDNHFARTASLPSQGSYNRWGDLNFQSTDFKEINKFAYFDYQREKIYLRTNKNVKSAVKRTSRKCSVKDNPVDKIISYVPTNCHHCGHDKFYKLNPRRKIHIDLKFMKNGVKRWNTLLPGTSFQCAACGDEFSPSKFGRNLLIWTMNQYITYMVSIPKIGNMLIEQFNIFVPENVRYQFKSALAEEYRETYDRIRQELVNGPLIHIDETKTELIGKPNGYVWVMTSMDTVYYFFRPNREAEFLKEFLAGFEGVLVSDFYNGYDSLSCQQQKCLIHFIRDLNNDLLINQMNAEYKAIVTDFGKLLRKIIATIDKHGLRKRYLQEHTKEIKTFYAGILNADYNTELAANWQKRFKKNEGKLFNFLNFDGVPWNNNNGENAIKPFAKYRRHAKGTLRQSGLEDYLILLSIQHTCKYRGINFLEFLKSKRSFFDRLLI